MSNSSTSCEGETRLSHTERLLWSVTALACASIMRGSRTPEGLRLAGQSHSLEQASGCENECEFPWRNDSMPPARELLCALSDPKERAGPPPAGGPSIARLLGQEARDWRASSGRRRATELHALCPQGNCKTAYSQMRFPIVFSIGYSNCQMKRKLKIYIVATSKASARNLHIMLWDTWRVQHIPKPRVRLIVLNILLT